jgi:hypothetical protein
MYLPYPPPGEPGGTSYVVTQGPMTCGSHCAGNLYNQYAYDFGMPTGSIVSAAHNGTVYDSYFGGSIGGRCLQSDDPYANYVSLQHSIETGKSTLYLHLQYNSGAEFTTGNGVVAYAGRPLARSSNTGYTCPVGGGAHLHFTLRSGLPRDSYGVEVWFDDASVAGYNGRPPANGVAFASSAPPRFRSQYVGGSQWVHLSPGATSSQTGQWRNTGWDLWRNTGNPTRLGVLNDQSSPLGGDGSAGCPPATGWISCSRVSVISTTQVDPGQIGWFPFTLKAPAANGTYDLRVVPVVDGIQWLQDEGVFWRVIVP